MKQKEGLVLGYLKNRSPKEQNEVLTILHHESPQLMAQLKKSRIYNPYILSPLFPKTILLL